MKRSQNFIFLILLLFISIFIIANTKQKKQSEKKECNNQLRCIEKKDKYNDYHILNPLYRFIASA